MRRPKGADRPWWESAEGATHQELRRQLARDELTVAEFETEIGKLVRTAADNSPNGDPFAPLTLADPPPTPARPDQAPVAAVPKPAARPPSGPRPRKPTGIPHDRPLAVLERELIQRRVMEEAADRERSAQEQQRERDQFFQGARGYVAPRALSFDNTGALWADLADVYVKRRRNETNIPVTLDADGGLSIIPDRAPPASRPGDLTPEQMRALGRRPVALRTRAQQAAHRRSEHEQLKARMRPPSRTAEGPAPPPARTAPSAESTPPPGAARADRDAAIGREVVELAPRSAAHPGAGSGQHPFTEPQLIANLTKLIRWHDVGLVSLAEAERVRGLLADYHARRITATQLWRRSQLTSRDIELCVEQFRAFAEQTKAATGPARS